MPSENSVKGREMNTEALGAAVPYKVCHLGDAEICFFGSSNLCAFMDSWENITHFHQCYVFHYVKAGTVEIEKTASEPILMGEGTLCVVPPGDVHPIPRSKGEIERTTLAIRLEKREKKSDGRFSEYAYYTGILSRIQSVQVINGTSLLPLIEKIGSLSCRVEASAEHILETYLSAFFIELCALLHKKPHDTVLTAPAREDRSMHKTHRRWIVEQYISGCYASEDPTGELMEKLHLSKRQTDRVVCQLMGESLAQLIVKQRMLVTKKYLQTTDLTLEEISERVGYRSYSGFYNAVRKLCGTTPENLAREMREE